MGYERESEEQTEELVNGDKDKFIEQKLPMQAKQTKEFIPYCPLAGKCSASSRKAGLHCMPWLFGLTISIALNVPSSFLPQFLLLSLISVGVSCPSWVPLTTSCTAPRLLTGGAAWETLTLCKEWWSVVKTSLCHQHLFSAQSQKNSTIWVSIKKIDALSAKTITVGTREIFLYAQGSLIVLIFAHFSYPHLLQSMSSTYN